MSPNWPQYSLTGLLGEPTPSVRGLNSDDVQRRCNPVPIMKAIFRTEGCKCLRGVGWCLMRSLLCQFQESLGVRLVFCGVTGFVELLKVHANVLMHLFNRSLLGSTKLGKFKPYPGLLLSRIRREGISIWQAHLQRGLSTPSTYHTQPHQLLPVWVLQLKSIYKFHVPYTKEGSCS